MLKPIFILLGSLSLAIGVLGIFLPGLPTTPFVLLSAGMYVKSSPFLYNKMKSNRFISPYMYITSKGISIKIKIFSISLMWIMIILSSFLAFSDWEWRFCLIILGIVGTYIKLRLPTRKTERKLKKETIVN